MYLTDPDSCLSLRVERCYPAQINRQPKMLEHQFRFESMEGFYRAAYAETLVAVSGPAALGATLIHARQGAGDYSDAAVPDLVITRGLSREIPATLDLGRDASAPPCPVIQWL